jgi:hypothetical protein
MDTSHDDIFIGHNHTSSHCFGGSRFIFNMRSDALHRRVDRRRNLQVTDADF